jgi:poly-gamma-glutamate synthesis protein (capsule biosynthesis protein)
MTRRGSIAVGGARRATWVALGAALVVAVALSSAARSATRPVSGELRPGLRRAAVAPVVRALRPVGLAGSDVGRPHSPVQARVAFVGDLALTLQIGRYLEAQSRGEPVPERIGRAFPFASVAARLAKADLVVGNLECFVSSRGKLSAAHRPLRCPLPALTALRDAGFDLLSVANNHVMDFGPLAFADTLRAIEERGMAHFGAAVFNRAPQQPEVRWLRGVSVAILGYYDDPSSQPADDVRRVRPLVDVVAVYAHWGLEDEPRPLGDQRRIGRALIDAGADLVVGTHAHVLQPTEWYRGRLIAYGLGNFAFSGMSDTDAHRRGAILEVDVSRSGLVGHRMVDTRLDDDGAPCILGERSLVPPAHGGGYVARAPAP